MISKGRVVLFRPTSGDADISPSSEPVVGIVVHVWSATMVNLAVFTADGTTFGRTSVNFAQREDGSPVPVGEEPPREGEYAVPEGAAWCSLVPRTG